MLNGVGDNVTYSSRDRNVLMTRLPMFFDGESGHAFVIRSGAKANIL
jgi:hypothetical protein